MSPSAPCVPQNVQTILECQSTVLNVTWQQRGQAHHYHTSVRSSDGQVMGCDSNATFCQVPRILCGLTYSVTVTAYSQSCNSSQSSVQHVTSGTCGRYHMYCIICIILMTLTSLFWILQPPAHQMLSLQSWTVNQTLCLCPGTLAYMVSSTLRRPLIPTTTTITTRVTPPRPAATSL